MNYVIGSRTARLGQYFLGILSAGVFWPHRESNNTQTLASTSGTAVIAEEHKTTNFEVSLDQNSIYLSCLSVLRKYGMHPPSIETILRAIAGQENSTITKEITQAGTAFTDLATGHKLVLDWGGNIILPRA